MEDKTITPEAMPEKVEQLCPKCGEEMAECENCEILGCPHCDGYVVTRDDVLLCPECAEACREDYDKMYALGCGSCSHFTDEDDQGYGWCELHQEPSCCIDKCGERAPRQ